MQMYMNYFDRHVKPDHELPTVGILLCDRKNEAVGRAGTLPEDANIYASKIPTLPAVEAGACRAAGDGGWEVAGG